MRRLLYLLPLLLSHCGPTPPALAPPLDVTAASDFQPTTTTGLLRIAVLDVGQGDAALIIGPEGTTILIDGGPPGAGANIILPYLHTHGIDHLTASIATHYDLDHIGGLPELFDGPDGVPHTTDDVRPTVCWDRGGTLPTDTAAIRAYDERRQSCQRTMEPGSVLRFGTWSLEALAVNGIFANKSGVVLDTANENTHSIVLQLTYGTFHYLTLGDLPGGGGEPPYTTVDLETPLAPLVGPVTILHAAHHGSQTSTNASFLAAIQPEAVVISVGDANPYGHPHPAVLRRLADLGIPIYLTEHGDQTLPAQAVVTNGPITIETDGKNFRVVTVE